MAQWEIPSRSRCPLLHMDMSCVSHLLKPTALVKSGPDVFYRSEFVGRAEYSILLLRSGHGLCASVAEEHTVAVRIEPLWGTAKS